MIKILFILRLLLYFHGEKLYFNYERDHKLKTWFEIDLVYYSHDNQRTFILLCESKIEHPKPREKNSFWNILTESFPSFLPTFPTLFLSLLISPFIFTLSHISLSLSIMRVCLNRKWIAKKDLFDAWIVNQNKIRCRWL